VRGNATLWRSTSILACCLAVISLAPAAAQKKPPADDSKVTQARERYKRAVSLFNSKDFGGALVEFTESYRLTKRFEVLYNIALTQMELKRWQDSLKTFRSYLDKGGAAISKDRRVLIEQHMTKSMSNLASVKLTVVGGPARVQVNGRSVGDSPLATAVLLPSGRFVFRATRKGHHPAEATLTVLSGKEYTLRLSPRLIPTTARLTVRANIPGVSLRVDGKGVGLVPWSGVLAAGGHNLIGSKTGYQTRQVEVGLTPGKDREVTLSLSRRAKPWFKRWYVLAGVTAVIVGGGGFAYYLCCVNANEQVHVP